MGLLVAADDRNGGGPGLGDRRRPGDRDGVARRRDRHRDGHPPADRLADRCDGALPRQHQHLGDNRAGDLQRGLACRQPEREPARVMVVSD